ncbi:Alpha/beta hydrolase family protein [Duganella sp. CF402]|uniref:alpha/beta fold hydrolase n=1 Tax=unclassified Duganella TaxID=2636909 RepID=UPI0008D53E23|nr:MULTISPECIES: alpha/beta hydrolase [unclassified Duganella]RZT09103.1 alpha/beta hydrolase family protein [Duganella sp. BK701]SEL70291.1 Alpha/beta hydrolase family protein [Duganella sp. CF402]
MRNVVFVLGLLAAAPAMAALVVTTLVDGRKVECVALKNPSAPVTVVFENGSRATVDKWDKVIDGIAPKANVFAYNRPGYGKSEDTAAPRDGLTIVEELRRNLKAEGLAPPYILVGHSLGGLYVQLFAKRHPEEVAGIVLVDALYPRVIKKQDDFPLLTRAGAWLFFSSTVRKEIGSIYETGEQVLAQGDIDSKPMIRLVNQPKGATAVPVDFGVVNSDPQTIAFVRALYPQAKTVVVDSDHQMQTASPEVIIQAINDVIAAQRK